MAKATGSLISRAKVVFGKQPKLVLAVVLAVIFLVHSSYLGGGFTWLDHNDLEQGKAILPLSVIPGALLIRFGQTGFYRPAITILYSLTWHLSGGNPGVFHLLGVLLHLLAVSAGSLLLTVFFQLTFWQLILGILIAGLHPAGWLVIGSPANFQESLLVIFSSLAVFWHARARDGENGRFSWLPVLGGWLFLSLALLTKETALVVVPALMIFWEFLNRFPRQKAAVWFWLGEVGVISGYVWLRHLAVPEGWATTAEVLPFAQAVGTKLGLLGRWLGQLVLPIAPGMSDRVAVVGLTDFRAVGTLGLLLLAGWVLIRRGIFSFEGRFLIIAGILLAPALDFVPVPRVGSPHYDYLVLPLVGVLGAFLISRLSNVRRPVKVVGLGAILSWLVVASWQSWVMGGHFRSDYSLLSGEVQVDPGFAEGHYYLGNYFLQTGDFPGAEREFRVALRPQSGYLFHTEPVLYQINLAGSLVSRGKLEEADELYDYLLARVQPMVRPYLVYNQALVALRQGDLARCTRLLSYGEATTAEAWLLLADCRHRSGDDKEAVSALLRAKPLLPADRRELVDKLIASFTNSRR